MSDRHRHEHDGRTHTSPDSRAPTVRRTGTSPAPPRGPQSPLRWIALLLIIPFVGTLWVPSYASITPELWGVPFFYWYQFAWIGISTLITIVVYTVEQVIARRATRDELNG